MKENRTAPPSWEGKRSAAAPPDAEVVDKPSRRRFSPSYKLRIVEEADRCTEPGEVGRLLRREGLYSSHLTTWRKDSFGPALLKRVLQFPGGPHEGHQSRRGAGCEGEGGAPRRVRGHGVTVPRPHGAAGRECRSAAARPARQIGLGIAGRW